MECSDRKKKGKKRELSYFFGKDTAGNKGSRTGWIPRGERGTVGRISEETTGEKILMEGGGKSAWRRGETRKRTLSWVGYCAKGRKKKKGLKSPYFRKAKYRRFHNESPRRQTKWKKSGRGKKEVAILQL